MTTSNTDEKLITKKDLLHSACNIGALDVYKRQGISCLLHIILQHVMKCVK